MTRSPEPVPVPKAPAEAGFFLQRIIKRVRYLEEMAGESRRVVEYVKYGEYVEFRR
jgi:hypothetical protein